MLTVYDAVAKISGNAFAPELNGTVKVLSTSGGSWVEAEIYGLPPFEINDGEKIQVGPFGFHINENQFCGRIYSDEPFSESGGIWNPADESFGNQAGNFPMLFSNHGIAKTLFYTDKFYPEDIIGKAVVIYQNPDNFSSLSRTNDGKRIACGTFEAI